MTSRILIGSSAVIFVYLGSVHLAYTFLTRKFSPTDEQLETSMKQIAPRISSEMTMWKAWMGFNPSCFNQRHKTKRERDDLRTNSDGFLHN